MVIVRFVNSFISQEARKAIEAIRAIKEAQQVEKGTGDRNYTYYSLTYHFLEAKTFTGDWKLRIETTHDPLATLSGNFDAKSKEALSLALEVVDTLIKAGDFDVYGLFVVMANKTSEAHSLEEFRKLIAEILQQSEGDRPFST